MGTYNNSSKCVIVWTHMDGPGSPLTD